MAERGPRPTINHVSSRPPKIPYGGFSPVRLQAQVPRSSICSLPTRHAALKSDPRHSRGIPCVCCSLWNGRPPARLPASVCGPLAKLVPPEPRGPRSSRVLLSLPSSLGDLIRQSGDLWLLSQHGCYSSSLWHSRALLPGLHTFRTFPAVLSRIAVCSFRRESGTCTPILPYQRWPSGRGKKPLAPPMLPPISFPWGPHFDGVFVRSRYGPPGCSPPGLIRPSRGSACLRFLPPGFQPSSHPENCRI